MSVRFDNANAYPLSWPDGFPRTAKAESSRFDTSLAKALDNVQRALAAFAKDSGKKLTDIIISSNYSLTDQRPKDAGVAVYFTWDNERTCIPVDRYAKVEDNLQAIYRCIEAKRTMLRHGGINLVKAAFRGYAALPPPAAKDWRDVLGKDLKTLDEARRQYRFLMRVAHPDKGGDPVRAAEVNEAWEQALKELTQPTGD